MEKEVVKPRTPNKIEYQFTEKNSLLQTLSKSIPKELKPTKRTGYVFGTIFLIVVIIALFRFPLGKMMAGDANVSIKVGLPMTFLKFDLMNPTESPAKINGLIIDILLYLFLAYAIDVILNLIMHNSLLESSEEEKKRLKVFKDKEQSKTIAEKITDKIIRKPAQTTTNLPQ